MAASNPIKTFLSKFAFDIIPTEENAWRIGAEVEEEIGELLAELPARHWTVRHDVMLDEGWNVDHIVVGPPGVFVLDAKFRSGDVRTSRRGIRVDGYASSMVDGVRDQAREVAERFRDILGRTPWVQPVLVFANEVDGYEEPDGVDVVELDELLEYLREAPRTMNTAEVERVAAAIQSDAMWTAPGR